MQDYIYGLARKYSRYMEYTVLFYGYKGILGFEVAWIDISTFFIAVFIAFGLQYHILINSHKKQTMNCGKILLIVNLIQFIAFVLLTYHPLGFGIFVSPV